MGKATWLYYVLDDCGGKNSAGLLPTNMEDKYGPRPTGGVFRVLEMDSLGSRLPVMEFLMR